VGVLLYHGPARCGVAGASDAQGLVDTRRDRAVVDSDPSERSPRLDRTEQRANRALTPVAVETY
jgi:hypothetical protein